MYNPETASAEEKEYLAHYDITKWPQVSLTTDIVIFTISETNDLSLLLIKRKETVKDENGKEVGNVEGGKWANPGGFLDIKESLNACAARELEEETNLKDLPITQFGTFGDIDRDPRGRIISVGYMAFVPKSKLNPKVGDAADEAQLFRIEQSLYGLKFKSDSIELNEEDLAFDHILEIKDALTKLRNRIDYTDEAFNFLKDSKSFTIYELKKIYEAVKGVKEDGPNFRRKFLREYVETGKVKPTGEKTKNTGSRAAELYCKVK